MSPQTGEITVPWIPVEHGQANRGSGPTFGRSWDEVRADPFAGIYVSRAGAVATFQALPRDGFGSMVDEADLTRRFTVLLRYHLPYPPQKTSRWPRPSTRPTT